MVGNSSTFWNVRAIPRLTTRCGAVRSSELPSNSTSPPSGLYRRVMTLKTVVLPAPLGPISPTMPPSSTSNETSSSATMPPNRRLTFRTERSPTDALCAWRRPGSMRSVTSGKCVLVAAGGVLALATAVGAAPPSRDGPAVLQRLVWRAQPVYCGGPRGRMVALTFDDGPGPYTLQVLDALRRGHARATFFLVGRRVAYWPQAARTEAGVGALGNHTWSHPHLRKLRPARARAELVRAQRAIVAETNIVPAVFRPPYEEATPRIDRMASRLGLLDVRWSVDSGDTLPAATPARVAAAVAAGVRPGSVVLLHDSHPWTARAVRLVLAELRTLRLRAVTATDLLELDPPTAAQLAPHANGRCG